MVRCASGPRSAAARSYRPVEKKDSSMVSEVRCKDGTWEAFLLDRLPQRLDDEIRIHRAKFYMAAEHLTPEWLLDTLRRLPDDRQVPSGAMGEDRNGLLLRQELAHVGDEDC